MKRKSSSKTASPGRPFVRTLLFWLVAVLVIPVVMVVRHGWRDTAPPPPVLNTNGFDPVIAAAVTDAREAVLNSPHSADARGRMGMVLLAHEIRKEAGECFAQASVFAPQNPRWPSCLGLAQLIDDPAAAATSFERAVRLSAESEPFSRLRLADALLTLGRVDEAETHFQHVRQREPNSAAAALGLGKVANARGLAKESADFFAAAIKDPSTRRAAHRLLITVNQRLGRTNEADQLSLALAGLPNDTSPDPLLSELEQLKTGEQAWLDRGDEWMNAGRIPDAAKLLEKTVQTYPKSTRAMFLYGRALSRLGDAAGAEAILFRAVKEAPGSIEAQMQLGNLYLSRGRAKQAQACFRAAIAAKPNLGEAWFNLGLTLGSAANRAESIAAFREAIRLKPGLIEAYLGLAVVLRADGQPQLAIHELRRALDLQPDEPLRKKLLDQLKLAGQP